VRRPAPRWWLGRGRPSDGQKRRRADRGGRDLAGGIALAIEMGADAVDIGRTIHPHPTLGERSGIAAGAAEGHCTDLPPGRR